MKLWTPEDEARVFACVLALKDIKLSKEDFNEISKMMSGEFSGEAIRQRVTKKIKKSFEGVSPRKPASKELQIEMFSPGKKSKGPDLKKKSVSAKKRGGSALEDNDNGEEEVAEKEADLPSKKIKAEPKVEEDLGDFTGLFDPYA